VSFVKRNIRFWSLRSFLNRGLSSGAVERFYDSYKPFGFFRRFNVMSIFELVKLRRFMCVFFAFYLICSLFFFSGCNRAELSSSSEVDAFSAAGPLVPEVDIDRLIGSRRNSGVYRVSEGDVLEFQMESILAVVSPEIYGNPQRQAEPYLCRVSDDGTITLPIVGQLQVSGETLAGIEASVVDLYYPRYVVLRPSVVCTVKEYYLENVTIAAGDGARPRLVEASQFSSMKYIDYSSASANSAGDVDFEDFGDGGVDFVTAEPEVSDYSSLDFDIVFRPIASSGTEGIVVVESGGEVIYSREMDILLPADRSEYVSGLERVVGTSQAYIVKQALEQLAGRLGSDMVVALSSSADELFEVVDDYDAGVGYDGRYIEMAVDDSYGSESLSPALSGAADAEPIVLPVKGLNVPFCDVPLIEGDLIEVKRLNEEVFTIIGLAKSPGAFPYPPDVEYNLMQVLGFAGGIDVVADPRYVSIYRQDSSGQVVSAVFRIDKEFAASSYNVKIKPGDVISLDVTGRTKMNVLLHQVLRLNFGLYVKPNY